MDLNFQRELKLLGNPPEGTPMITVVRRALWDGRRFINCFGEFGSAPASDGGFEYDRAKPGPYWKPFKSGNLAAYVDGLREPFAQSPTLLFSFLLAFVPPLMLRMDVADESFCVALTGETTTGKTLATRVCLSATTRARPRDLKPMNMTLGRAGELGRYSGTVLTLGDPKGSRDKGLKLAEVIQTAVFSIADGVVREGLTADPGDPPEACIALFSFEQAVVPFLENNGLELGGGDRVRILDEAVRDGADGGIFELNPGSARQLAVAVKATLREHHGVAFPYWITFIGGLALERVNELVDRFRADFDRLAGPLTPLEVRYTEGARWTYVAGRIALRSKKLKVIDGATFDSHFKLLVARALKDFNSGDMAFQADIDQVRKALVSRATFPFERVGKRANKKACANGFRRKEAEGMLVYVRPTYVDGLIYPNERVLRQFERDGAFIRNGDELTWPILQMGLERRRYLKFNLDRLRLMQNASHA